MCMHTHTHTQTCTHVRKGGQARLRLCTQMRACARTEAHTLAREAMHTCMRGPAREAMHPCMRGHGDAQAPTHARPGLDTDARALTFFCQLKLYKNKTRYL